MGCRVGTPLRLSLMLSVPVWCAFVAQASAACVTDATTHNVTCDGVIINQASPGTTNPPGTGYPLTIYDQAAQFQPINGGKVYPTTGYNQDPPPAIVTFNQGSSITANITTANRTTMTSDSGLVVANYSDSESPAVNNVIINNSGILTLNNAQSASRVHVLVGDSQVNTFTVNNTALGQIVVNQTTTNFTTAFNKALLANTSSGNPATLTATYAGTAFGITSGMYSDDNTNSFVINNSGILKASGHFATPYYGRADTTVINAANATIANTDWTPSDTISAGHWAIAAYAGTEYTPAPNTNPDSSIVLPNANGTVSIDDTSALTLRNKAGGTIKGDILALDITPLVYAAAVGASTNPFPNPGQTTLLQLPVSSSNAGPRDSDIVNRGTIQGNFYLGSGAHEIHNAVGATLQGSVYVDQRPFLARFSEPVPAAGQPAGTYVSNGSTDFNGNTCPAANQNTTNAGCAKTANQIATVVGDQTLTLVNRGTFTGDIRIFDEATSVNKITLHGDGFSGNVVAVNGTGDNTLRLDGVTNLASVQNFRTLNLTQSNVTVANGVSLVDGATIRTAAYGPGGTRAAPSTSIGTINGTLTLQGATAVVPTFASLVRNGDVFQVASTVTGPGAGNVTVKQPQSALVRASADTSDGRLLLTTQVRDARTLPGISQQGGATLQGLLTYNGNNPQVYRLGGIVEGLHSIAQVRQAADALAPVTNGADVQTPINSAMLFHQQIDSRLDSFVYAQIPSNGRSADLGVPRAVPVYGALPTSGAWIEGIGGGVHQSSVGGATAYDASLVGVIGGYDRLIVPGLRVGGAFGYIDGRINGNANLIGSRDDIQTYQGLAYATWEGANYYLRGSVGYGGVNYQSAREISFAGFSDTAFGSHSGNILTTRGEAGVPYEYLSSLLVPYAAFTYSRLQQNAYTETSSAGAALAYQSARNNSERSEVGGKIIVPLTEQPMFSYLFPTGSVVALEGRAAYVHEFGNVAQTVSAAFTGGGNVFVAAGPVPNRDMVDYGVGLRMSSGRVQIDLQYDGLARSNFYQQVGLLRARYMF